MLRSASKYQCKNSYNIGNAYFLTVCFKETATWWNTTNSYENKIVVFKQMNVLYMIIFSQNI